MHSHPVRPGEAPTDLLRTQATFYGRQPNNATHTTSTSAWVDAANLAIAFGAFAGEAILGFFPALWESLTTRIRKAFR